MESNTLPSSYPQLLLMYRRRISNDASDLFRPRFCRRNRYRSHVNLVASIESCLSHFSSSFERFIIMLH